MKAAETSARFNYRPKKKNQKKYADWQDGYNVDKYTMPNINFLNVDDYTKKMNEAYEQGRQNSKTRSDSRTKVIAPIQRRMKTYLDIHNTYGQ